MQRVQFTHRSRSSRTCEEIAIGLGEGPFDTLEAGIAAAVGHRLVLQRAFPPALVAHRAVQRMVDEQQFHHPPCWALSATGDVNWVRTIMPSVTVVVHEASGLRWPSTSTRHWRHAPAGSRRGVVAEPRDADAELFGCADHESARGEH